MAEQEERRLVGPVDIVEYEHDRPFVDRIAGARTDGGLPVVGEK